MSSGENVIQLAEIRLAQMIEEGIVTGTGVSSKGGEEHLFVGIDPGIDKNSPQYRSKIYAINERLKGALQGIPFEMLGHYDDDLIKEGTDDALGPAPTPRSAAVGAPSHVAPPTESLMAEIVRLRESNEGLHASNRRWEELFKEQLVRVAEAQREIEQLRAAVRNSLDGNAAKVFGRPTSG